jgi:hypothetical protein
MDSPLTFWDDALSIATGCPRSAATLGGREE